MAMTAMSLPRTAALATLIVLALVVPPLPAGATTLHFAPATSHNWAGFVVSAPNGAITSVSANWTVPRMVGSCAGSHNTSEAGFWVGLDGWNDSTVEQVGTAMSCYSSPSNHSVRTYFAFYELYPWAATILSSPVRPGDNMTGRVSYSASPGAFAFWLNDTTLGWSFNYTWTIYLHTPVVWPNRSSAEWIAEDPASSTGAIPLTHFARVTFTSCSLTIAGHVRPAGSPAALNATHPAAQRFRVTMWNLADSSVMATPWRFLHNGTSFWVTWNSAGP